MSMSFPSLPVPRRATPRRAQAENFGELIRAARRNSGRSLDELAPRAALTVAEWEAIEAGEIPEAVEQVYLLMQALALGSSWRPYLMELFIGAWKE